jgi:hypothetical protein
MLYFINLNQVANVNPAFGANFSAGSELTDELLTHVAESFTGMHQPVSEAMLADVRAYRAAVEAAGAPLAPFVATYGDYTLTLTPEAEAEVPWIVEGIMERRALQTA